MELHNYLPVAFRTQIAPSDLKGAEEIRLRVGQPLEIMYADETDVDVINEKASEYASLQASTESAAKRGYVDSIINPEVTRKNLIYAFEMLFTKREDRLSKKHGTV